MGLFFKICTFVFPSEDFILSVKNIFMQKKLFLWCLIALSILGCEEPTPTKETTVKDSASIQAQKEEKVASQTEPSIIPYQLNAPNSIVELPNDLNEISGLSLSEDGLTLIANNDEEGKIFFIDINNGQIVHKIKFAKKGDYEGIERVGDKIYVTTSNGKIYEVDGKGDEKQEATKHKTFLELSNDVEGLAFDADENRLLLACKGKAGKGKEFKGKRGIYGFDLKTNVLSERPVFLIDREKIQEYTMDHPAYLEKILESFTPDQAASAFSPSGIAIHPSSKNIYIVSSVGKLLLVLKPDGTILHIEKLNKTMHRQPEGICFDKDGTMYISSEGKEGKGKIFMYNVKK